MSDAPRPSSIPAIRPDDDAREATVRRLADAFASGMIPMEEFESRMEAVYRADSRETLRALTADLGAPVPAAMAASAPYAPRVPQVLRAAFSSVSGTRLTALSQTMEITARFGSIEDVTIDTMPRRLELNASFGSVEVDLRYATFQPGVTEIEISGMCGSIEIYLPIGVTLDNMVDTFLGTVEIREKGVRRGELLPPIPESRLATYVRITGQATLSSVEVRLMPT